MRLAAALALTLAAAALAAAPVQAQRGCVTRSEAESLTLVALPEIIAQTGRLCADRLPATSLVRRTSGPFLAKYQSEADRAWPAARAALIKVTDPSVTGLLGSDHARPLLTSLAVPLIVGRLRAEDCPVVDRLVTQLAPLPPRNTAAVVVTTLAYLKAEKARGRPVAVPDLPLCPGVLP